MLYPNRTSQAFACVGYNGQDFLSFDTENVTWTLSQDTRLSSYMPSFLQNYTALNELVEMIFNDTCADKPEVILQYGMPALERQGETTLTLQQPPQSPRHWGPAMPHRGFPHPFALIPQSCLWPRSSPAPSAQTSCCLFAMSLASTPGPSAWPGCGMARRCLWAQCSTPAPSCPTLTSPTSSAASWPWPPMMGTAMSAVCATRAWAPAAFSSRGVGATHGDVVQPADRRHGPCEGQLLTGAATLTQLLSSLPVPENGSTAPTISIIIAVLLLVATASAGGFWWWKHR